MKSIALLALFLLAGCPSPTTPTVEPADGDYPDASGVVEVFEDDSAGAAASPCGKACANLARLHCPEGSPTRAGVSCYRGCLSMAKQQRVPSSCWSLAKTPDDARACGGLRCILTP